MKWRNLREILDRRTHLGVDHPGLDEMPSVHDTVTDGIDILRANGVEIVDDLRRTRPPRQRCSLRLVDPALTTSTVSTRSVRPGPVADLRIVVAVLARIRASPETPVLHGLPQMCGSGSQSGNAIDDVHDEVLRRSSS